MYGSTRKCPGGSVLGDAASIGPVHHALSVDWRAGVEVDEAITVSAFCCASAPSGSSATNTPLHARSLRTRIRARFVCPTDVRSSSVRGLTFIIYSRVLRDPVQFPGLAAIVRKCLLEETRRRSDFRPNIPNEYHPSVEDLLIEKLAAAVLEFTHGRNAQRATSAIRRIEAPLLCLG